MEQENINPGKGKNLVIVILVVLVLALAALSTLVIMGNIKLRNNELGSTSNINEQVKESEQENTNVLVEKNLDKAVGEWGMCDDDHGCYGINIVKTHEQNYTYRPYQMWSDGFYAGKVVDIEKVDGNTFRLTVHFDAIHNMLTDVEEHTNEYVIDFSKVNQDIIIVDSVEYKKIVGDRETFFNELNK